MKRIAIIDYGLCNIDSVSRAVEICGGKALVVRTLEACAAAEGIILPGVGAFPDAMAGLGRQGLTHGLRSLVEAGNHPFLGICLGMQLMADHGEEAGGCAGLGLIPGRTVRLAPQQPAERIPHVGWNEVRLKRPSALFENIPTGRDFYFVHSYHFAADADCVLAETPYCGGFTSVVEKGIVFGTQFHPEKSLTDGLTLLRNFVALC